ncbi:hypothetical protein LI951_08990 [Enterococcus sp. BWT-B8]|uniref:hypothetical protein n=1 Tax=Enterococcus sp. BWT-B8 TaxID=2885157 RepID=UPI001E5FB054|nr:hypothetical protein [Enterococcus sp. BWT-B8]MCB5952197.1 hypothetical protein [Enterococcus sp. BWT-B8]
MKKNLIYGFIVTILLGSSLLFVSSVNAEEVIQHDALIELQTEIGSQSINPKTRAYVTTVLRYFHQYQTRLTGNWAPNLHGYIYGTINVQNGYAASGWTHLGTTSNSNWLTLEHKFAQNYRVW